MGGSGGKLLFRLGLAAALVSICLSAFLISDTQSGPSWEVPVAVVTELATLPWLALLLAGVAALLYWLSRRRGTVSARSQQGFMVTLVIATLLPLAIWLFQPAQWAYQFLLLSMLAALLVFPVFILSILYFWLIGFRWLNTSQS